MLKPLRAAVLLAAATLAACAPDTTGPSASISTGGAQLDLPTRRWWWTFCSVPSRCCTILQQSP